MCYAIIRVVYADGHKDVIDVDTAEELPDRLAKVELAEQAERYTVFVAHSSSAKRPVWVSG